jgi:hypothetical protein
MSKDKDYEVGYGKPPRHTRFKKGQSGNPKGRPRGRRNTATIMQEILERPVKVKEDGRTRRMSLFEAFLTGMAQKGLNGTMNDRINFLKAIDRYLPHILQQSNLPEKVEIEFIHALDGTPITDEELDRLRADREAAARQKAEEDGTTEADPEDYSFLD